jgi:hypothetical protein
VNDDWEMAWKEMVVVYFDALSKNLLIDIEENYEKRQSG